MILRSNLPAWRRRKIGARVSTGQPQAHPSKGRAASMPRCPKVQSCGTISAGKPTARPVKASRGQALNLLRAAKIARRKISRIDVALATLTRDLERLAAKPLADQLVRRRAPKHAGGRPRGVTMPCGWSCGATLTARQMRKHFTNCPNRPH